MYSVKRWLIISLIYRAEQKQKKKLNKKELNIMNTENPIRVLISDGKRQIWLKEDNIHKSAVTQLFLWLTLTFWPFDPKINVIQGLIFEHFYVKLGDPRLLAASIFEIWGKTDTQKKWRYKIWPPLSPLPSAWVNIILIQFRINVTSSVLWQDR